MERKGVDRCRCITETDAELIPTGTVGSGRKETPMDFRKEKVVEKEIGADYTPLKLAGGYDHNWY